MMRIIGTLAVSVAFAACSTVASTVGFPAADADDDDMVNRAEFNEFFDDTDLFERFDDDDNGNLNRTEYNEAVDDAYETDAYFRGLDRDNSNTLSRDEFIGVWFDMFDGDRSGTLTRGEFRNAIE